MTNLKKWLNSHFIVPILLLIGHALALSVILSFFIYTSLRPVPFNDYLAPKVRDYPQVTSLVVTLIGTMIGSFISYLFCHSVCYAVNIHLIERGMSLRSLSALIKIATGSPILGHGDSLWAYVALGVALALLAQPAALTAILTPTSVTLTYPITGQELDLTNSAAFNILGPPLTTYGINASTQPGDVQYSLCYTHYTVTPSVISSGEMGARAALSLPSFFSFNNYSYVGKTNGVLPANLVPMSNIIPPKDKPYTFLPANARIEESSRLRGLGANYTMTQQGYQPKVTCRRATDDVTVTIQNDASITASVTCPNDRAEITVPYTDNQSSLFAIDCAVGPDIPSEEYEIHLKGDGPLYGSIDYTCKVNSDVVVLDVHYGSTQTLFNSSGLDILNFTSSSSQRIPVPRLAYEAVSIFVRQVMYSQGSVNTVGNIALAFDAMNNGDSGSDLLKIWVRLHIALVDIHSVDMLLYQESYLESSLQFASTLIRTNLTSSNSSVLNITQKYPDLPVRTMNGTYRVQTLGWSQSSDLTHRAIFAAPMTLVLFSMLVTLVTFIRSLINQHIINGDVYFTSTDAIHLIAATSSGTVQVKPDYRHGGIFNDAGIWVRLDSNNGGPLHFEAGMKEKHTGLDSTELYPLNSATTATN
ncbi:hypothetical protein AMATHDRAFT_49866 [Amanita thiersii Skay4041]|uniref:Uncharacterized protein n=1 Tax=Amanita thiersii Skay4041 TaxID=703135 RepID=A0A2A9NBJ4_9AGAR|nr:hypothetical protein AMATHDRAFT_49866 [Amanita thiersii Skay4041]